MPVVTMRQLLDSGVHFGHQTRRWNPKMKRFIFTERNGIYIIDLQQSLSYIDRAYEFVKETVAHGGTILFVGTKKQAQEAIAEQAGRVGMPYVNHRWLGGMLTNFSTVSKRVQRMKELEEIDFEDVAGSQFTKKELLLLNRELEKLQANLGGIRNMAKTPSAVWVVDTKKEHLAVDEAQKLGIPVVAILDTNCDPDEVAYPIPGNDDAIRSVNLLTRVVADADGPVQTPNIPHNPHHGKDRTSMANYTAADIKALRERTGAGMMDVKKALDEADGDAEKAIEIIRVKGLKGATKREGRSAAEGLVAATVENGVGVMIELNCETDFVAKADKFIALGDVVLRAAVASGATDVDGLLASDYEGRTLGDYVTEEGALLGEKVAVRRLARVEGAFVDAYLHKTSKDLPAQVGVLLAVDADSADAKTAAHDIAVHTAAYSPTYLTREDVPAETVENERRIADETARAEGKPEQALPKIVEGRLTGFFKEIVLVDQPFAKDPKQTVGKVASDAGTNVTGFARFRVGN